MNLLNLLTVLFLGFVCGTAASGCPPKMKVQNPTPKCRDDYDCRKYYQICCPNAYNARSCTYPAPYASLRDHPHHKSAKHRPHPGFKSYKAKSIWMNCNGGKCTPYGLKGNKLIQGN